MQLVGRFVGCAAPRIAVAFPRMIGGLWRIGIGLSFIAGGLSGQLGLRWTVSGALAVVGVVLVATGISRIQAELRADAARSARSRRALWGTWCGTRRPPWMPSRRAR